MGVRLERFSHTWHGAAKQARTIGGLVATEQEWLREARPGVVERYRDFPHAVYNTRRLARADFHLHPYIIKSEGGDALGLASLILHQVIAHPSESDLFFGTDVDYWLLDGAADHLHTETATILKGTSDAHAIRVDGIPGIALDLTQGHVDSERSARGRSTPFIAARSNLIAVIAEGQINPPQGLAEMLHQVGEPAHLNVPPPEVDEFDITKGGQLARLYYAEDFLQVPVTMDPTFRRA